MKNHFIILLLVMIMLSNCTSGDSITRYPDNLCRQELCYEGPFDPPWISAYDNQVWFTDEPFTELPCDNKVLETENILTFSDASSDEVKIDYAQMAELSLSELKTSYNLKNSELGINDLYTKLRIYSNRFREDRQHANLNGFLLMALDNPFWDTWGGGLEGEEFLAYYQRNVKHEMMHVFQFRLGARKTDVWFREGIAEHMAEGTFPAITKWEQVEEWQNDLDHTNPISIHKNEDYPSEASSSWYQMFRLAVRYLLDNHGHGRSLTDVKNMFLEVKAGVSFSDAFENHFELSISYYEENFWDLMKLYLPIKVPD